MTNNTFNTNDRVISTEPVTVYDPMDFLPIEMPVGSIGTVERVSKILKSGTTLRATVVRFDEQKIPYFHFDTSENPKPFKLII